MSDDIEQFMTSTRADLAQAAAPKATVPDKIDDPDLRPRLADTPEKQAIEYQVRLAAKNAGVDPHLAASVAKKESQFDPNAVSPTGVKGVMQVSHIAAQDVGMDPQLVRNDPNANIQAGVQYLAKHGLSAYPDPAVRTSYMKAVNADAAKSRQAVANDRLQAIEDEINSGAGKTSDVGTPSGPDSGNSPVSGRNPANVSAAPAMIQGAWEGTGADLVSRKLGLDKVRAYLDKNVPDIDAILGKMGLADLKYDKTSGQFVHDPNYKPSPSSDEMRAAQQKETQASIAANPGTYDTAKVLGFMAGPGQAIAGATPSVASKLISGALQGVTGGAGYEAVTNPNATMQSVAQSAGKGGLTGAGLSAAGKVVSGVGRAITDFVVGKKGMGQFVDDTFGPTLSKASLKIKNAMDYVKNEANLQDILDTHSDKLINVGDILKPQDVLQLAVDKEGKFDHDLANKLFGIAQRAEAQGGQINPGDANILKRVAWDRSYTENGLRNSETAKIFQKIGNALKTRIEDTTSDPAVAAVNQNLGKNISLRNALTRLDKAKPGKMRLLMEAGTAMAAPHTIPALLAGHAITSIPGGTTLSAAGGGLSNPAVIQALLGSMANKQQ